MGCAAHALSLMFKDVCNAKKNHVPWMHNMYSKVLQISDTINGCAPLMQHFYRVQEETLLKKGKKIPTHVPTRFAIVHLITVVVLELRLCLINLVNDSGFAQAAKNIKEDRRGDLVKFIKDAAFWKALEKAVYVMAPVAEAIKKLEGDYPLLSAVYPKYVALKKHAEAYETELSTNPSRQGAHWCASDLREAHQQASQASPNVVEEVV